jgi:hypothetical protein
MNVRTCSIIALPKIIDSRGNLTFVESDIHVPFNINRVYFLYDVPSRSCRGGHSHLDLWQLLIAISGSFSVTIDDGDNTGTVTLNAPDEGLLIGPGVWRELNGFSAGSVCLVLASNKYNEADYIRDYDIHVKTFSQGT